MSYAIDAAYYCYYYRRAYEKQISEEDQISTRYALSYPTTVACFLVVSALYGIVGNFVYDLVKKVFLKILKNAQSLEDNIGRKRIKISN